MTAHPGRVSGRKVREIVHTQGNALERLAPVLRGMTAQLQTQAQEIDALTLDRDRLLLPVTQLLWERTCWQRLRWLFKGQ
jgi:hypothetical protein